MQIWSISGEWVSCPRKCFVSCFVFILYIPGARSQSLTHAASVLINLCIEHTQGAHQCTVMNRGITLYVKRISGEGPDRHEEGAEGSGFFFVTATSSVVGLQ